MILPIRTYGDPVLRRVARPVTQFDDDLRRLAADMIETMHSAQGVGLAAPQVGVPKRLFVALELPDGPDADEDEEGAGATADAAPAAEADAGESRPEPIVHVLVNPEITRREGLQVAPDGCLSLPGLSVDDMERDLRVRVRYQDLDGVNRERDAEGHFAHVLQHEHDHLEGVLFFDRLPGPRRQRFLEEHRGELAELQRRAKAHLKSLRASPAPAGRG